MQVRQRQRIDNLLAHATANSVFYRELYGARAPEFSDLATLPIVTKPAPMSNFEEWVSDERISLNAVREFISDPSRTGHLYLDEYFVASSSGTSGHPGIFLHDRDAVTTYQAFTARLDTSWLGAVGWARMLAHRFRWVAVVGTGGHFAGEGWMELSRHRNYVSRRAFSTIGLQQPLASVVAQLNDLNPAVLTSYPSALEALALEQQAGRLRIHPVFIEPGGETLTPELRDLLVSTFECPVHDVYSASEALVMAYDCSQKWLHINAD